MRYLLDTDTCIYIAKDKPPQVLARLTRLREGDVGMSVITYAELSYGASKSRQVEANWKRIDRLASLVPVLPLGAGAARHYGALRYHLERRGSPIGAHDLLIAAHALDLNLTLVTNNTREFTRVEGLRIENWV
jgi:tRNA(fMet)-specific endonuclease VapC